MEIMETETHGLSVIVSVYNEEQALEQFYHHTSDILQQLSLKYEILFVNDGSRDGSGEILDKLAQKDSAVGVIHFSRNFGHEAAMIAGIDNCTGDWIVCMDADLQHPPECIPGIVEKFQEGYEIINMVRLKNPSAGWMKNVTSEAFYGLINKMSDVHMEKNASDFFALDHKAAEVLRRNYREKVRFLRGYVQNIGFRKTNLTYEAAPRVAGKSKYNMRKLLKFSIHTIICFSDLPLKLGIYAGTMAGFLGVIMAVYTVVTWAAVGTPNGYATIIVLLCFMFAILFFLVGIMGGYIGILFTELKDRPIYIIEHKTNL